jgi:DNA-binding FadR family transcriptional regulator
LPSFFCFCSVKIQNFIDKQYITLDNSYGLLYTVCNEKEEENMRLIINTSLMVPIYEQIVDQIKGHIRTGELNENDPLPSVRTLAKELKISALTVKRPMTHWKQKDLP